MADLDSSKIWLRRAFLIPTDSSAKSYGSGTKRRNATSAAFKFTNTSLGGNYAINNPPQFTKYCDIRLPGRGRSKTQKHLGMGSYYSEAIDDPKQVIHVALGVPQFSSWTSFLTNFYDSYSAMLANTGTVSPFWYNLGNAIGYIVTLPLQPIVIGLGTYSRVMNFLSKQSPTKWYYFKPTMHTYWSAVNTLANEFAVELGIVPRVFGKGQEDLEDPNMRVTEADRKHMHAMFPEVFKEGGGVDIMSLAGRTQRMANASQAAIRQLNERATSIKALREGIENSLNEAVTDPNPGVDANDYFLKAINKDPVKSADSGMQNSFSTWSELTGVLDFINGSLRDGSQFVTFRVEHNGSLSESFSNSTQQTGVAQMINQRVVQGRDVYYNTMGGSVTEFIGGFVNDLKSMAAGALDSVNLGGLAVLAGSAFVDVPEMWADSVASLPSASYTIPLPSIYGNLMSRFMNLYIPLSMILPMGLPRSAGPSAYTSPFLCQIFHQGRVQKQLCIVDNISIRRGTGTVGWTSEGQMLGAEISISFKDLTRLMHVPLRGGFATPSLVDTTVKAAAVTLGETLGGDKGAGAAIVATDKTIWDEQSMWMDYVAAITGQNPVNSFEIGKRLNLNITRSLQDFKTWRSPANFMSYAMESAPGKVLSIFAQTTDRF